MERMESELIATNNKPFLDGRQLREGLVNTQARQGRKLSLFLEQNLFDAPGFLLLKMKIDTALWPNVKSVCTPGF